MLFRLFLSILFNEKFNLLLRTENFQDSSHRSLTSEGTKFKISDWQVSYRYQ
jgi:hypothetical protein